MLLFVSAGITVVSKLYIQTRSSKRQYPSTASFSSFCSVLCRYDWTKLRNVESPNTHGILTCKSLFGGSSTTVIEHFKNQFISTGVISLAFILHQWFQPTIKPFSTAVQNLSHRANSNTALGLQWSQVWPVTIEELRSSRRCFLHSGSVPRQLSTNPLTHGSHSGKMLKSQWRSLGVLAEDHRYAKRPIYLAFCLQPPDKTDTRQCQIAILINDTPVVVSLKKVEFSEYGSMTGLSFIHSFIMVVTWLEITEVQWLGPDVGRDVCVVASLRVTCKMSRKFS